MRLPPAREARPTQSLHRRCNLEVDVAIVGAGPAGAAAAIQLAHSAPALARRAVVLDAARFPRPKLCGGGVVREADRFLGMLGVTADVPSTVIHRFHIEFAGGVRVREAPNAFRVVRRDAFDHALVRAAESLGVEVHQGAAVRRVSRVGDAILVETTRQTYRARFVIGADGARSLVRRGLVGGRSPSRFVALDVVAPGARSTLPDTATAAFDFRPTAEGLHGYAWTFPCLVRGQAAVNRGYGGASWPRGASLRDAFGAWLANGGVGPFEQPIEGATIPMFHPRVPLSAERVVLAGDAMGTDPWLGEGISSAIGSGMLAARAAAAAFASGDFTNDAYARNVGASVVGWNLRRNRAIARSFYRAATRPDGLGTWLDAIGTHR